MILTEQIHYSVAGISEALDKLRQFAIARGWTVDYWQPSSMWDVSSPFGWKAGTETNLQLHSPGYGNQEMHYRWRSAPGADPAADQCYHYGVYPADRYHDLITTHPISQNTYYPATSYTNWTSVPPATFDSMYLYGNDKFISMTLKVTSMSVITFTMGTIDLFKSWENYSNGLAFLFANNYVWTGNSNYKWYNIDSFPGNWYMPFCASSYRCYFEDTLSAVANNYTPTPLTGIGAELGAFNRMVDFLWFNTFTDKRLAFRPTLFIRDPSSLVYYPCGLAPFAYVNGTNLSFGETVNFGTDEFKCYPAINIPNPIWVAYQTA